VLQSDLESEVVGFGVTTIGVDTGDDEGSLLGLKEGGTVGKIYYQHRCEQSEEDGDHSEEKEDPSPSLKASSTYAKKKGNSQKCPQLDAERGAQSSDDVPSSSDIP